MNQKYEVLIVEDDDSQRRQIIQLAEDAIREVCQSASGVDLKVTSAVNTNRMKERIAAHISGAIKIVLATTDRNLWKQDLGLTHAKMLTDAGISDVAIYTDDTGNIEKEAAGLGVRVISKDDEEELRSYIIAGLRRFLALSNI